jgi:hypothetical protein
MKRLALILSVLLLSITTAYSEDGWRENEMEVKVFLDSREDAEKLGGLNLVGDIYLRGGGLDGFGTMYVTPDELKKIENLNLPCEIVIKNLNEYSKDFWNKRAYRTYQQIINAMDKLEDDYPNLCKKTVYGSSVQNRELSALKISANVNVEENEPEMIFDGGIHGNEVGGPENVLLFAEDLCEKYGSDQQVTDLLDSREVWLYCMVNPDGRVADTRYNANRIDLNRNWAYMTTMTSKGFSEPELRGVRDCLMENQFVIQITYHSGIECVLYPWGLISAPSADKTHHEPLADTYFESSNYSRLDVMSSYQSYYTTGETLDYSYGAMGISALTMEISFDKSPSDITGYYNKNYNAMLTMIEYAGYGVEGIIKDAQTGEPVSAVVWVDDSYPVYSDPEVGDYHKYVVAGTYDIRVTANGYVSKTVNNVAVQDKSSTVTDIELERDITSNSTWGYKVVFVGRGQNSGAVNTPDVLGQNDNKSFILRSGSEMVIGMQFPIKDLPGNDIKVHVSGSSGNYTCNAGQEVDGPWKSLGSGNSTQEFDLSEGNIAEARYIQIDGNCGIDAIEALGGLTNIADNTFSAQNPTQLTVGSVRKNVSFHVQSVLPYSLKIYNTKGKLCWKPNTSQPSRTYTWQAGSTGMYLARLETKGTMVTKRFLVVK